MHGETTIKTNQVFRTECETSSTEYHLLYCDVVKFGTHVAKECQ
jgi:hypothetical protein